MILLFLFILTIIVPSIFILKKSQEVVIYISFFFFWELGLLRMILFKEFSFQDKDLPFLENLIVPLNLQSFNFYIVFFQIILFNFILLIFIKKTTLLLNKINPIKNKTFTYNSFHLRLLNIIILSISIFIIRNSIISIIAGTITGYAALTNFEGSWYYVHVFLNRLSLLIFLVDIINSKKINRNHLIGIIAYGIYFTLLGQRNELFGFLISLLVFLSTQVKRKGFVKIIFFGFCGLTTLRIIENFRSGNYNNKIIELFIDSTTTFYQPFFGAESIIPFYSIYASTFIEGLNSIIFFLGWILQSFGLVGLNLETTYSTYKDAFFPYESRGYAINLIASLNIYENWFMAIIYLVLIFFLIQKIMIKIYKFSKKFLPESFILAIMIYSIQSIILLGRNGIEGIRPLFYHNFILYPILLYLIFYGLKKIK